MPSNHLNLCRPLLLPSVFPKIRVFSNESALGIRWPKYWSFINYLETIGFLQQQKKEVEGVELSTQLDLPILVKRVFVVF